MSHELNLKTIKRQIIIIKIKIKREIKQHIYNALKIKNFKRFILLYKLYCNSINFTVEKINNKKATKKWKHL